MRSSFRQEVFQRNHVKNDKKNNISIKAVEGGGGQVGNFLSSLLRLTKAQTHILRWEYISLAFYNRNEIFKIKNRRSRIMLKKVKQIDRYFKFQKFGDVLLFNFMNLSQIDF